MNVSIRLSDKELREAVCLWLSERGFLDVPPDKMSFTIAPNGTGAGNIANAIVSIETDQAQGPYR